MASIYEVLQAEAHNMLQVAEMVKLAEDGVTAFELADESTVELVDGRWKMYNMDGSITNLRSIEDLLERARPHKLTDFSVLS